MRVFRKHNEKTDLEKAVIMLLGHLLITVPGYGGLVLGALFVILGPAWLLAPFLGFGAALVGAAALLIIGCVWDVIYFVLRGILAGKWGT